MTKLPCSLSFSFSLSLLAIDRCSNPPTTPMAEVSHECNRVEADTQLRRSLGEIIIASSVELLTDPSIHPSIDPSDHRSSNSANSIRVKWTKSGSLTDGRIHTFKWTADESLVGRFSALKCLATLGSSR